MHLFLVYMKFLLRTDSKQLTKSSHMKTLNIYPGWKERGSKNVIQVSVSDPRIVTGLLTCLSISFSSLNGP